MTTKDIAKEIMAALSAARMSTYETIASVNGYGDGNVDTALELYILMPCRIKMAQHLPM